MTILQLVNFCRALARRLFRLPALPITASLIHPAKLKIQYVEKLRENSQFGKEGESVVQLS